MSHESNSASGLNGKNAGLAPPRLAPKGVATWNAAGMNIWLAAVPKTLYTVSAVLAVLREATSLYVSYPAFEEARAVVTGDM